MVKKAFKMFLNPGMADIMKVNLGNSPVSIDLRPVFHLE